MTATETISKSVITSKQDISKARKKATRISLTVNYFCATYSNGIIDVASTDAQDLVRGMNIENYDVFRLGAGDAHLINPKDESLPITGFFRKTPLREGFVILGIADKTNLSTATELNFKQIISAIESIMFVPTTGGVGLRISD